MARSETSARLCILITLIGFASGAEQEYQRLSRQRHNEVRARHQVNPLVASDDLNNRAIQCAQHYAQKGQIDHSCPHKNGAGENLWAQWGGTPTNTDAATNSASSWYSEEPQHDYNRDWQPASGHFSQMVWRNSRNYGFGVARNGNMIVGCALYSPPGNVLNRFRENVFPPN